MKPLALALFLLLLCSVSLCFWVQNLAVTVKDAAGNPVPDAQVEVRYQKFSKTSGTDGYTTGFTDEKGAFAAKLTNSVQSDEITEYTVSVNTFFWEGQAQTLNAISGREASSTANFVCPQTLSPYLVRVIDVKKKAVRGATVTLSSPIYATRITDTKGSALFRMPQNTKLTGTVAYEGASATFDSQSANLNGGTYEMTVPLASDFSSGAGASSHTLDLQVLDSKKKPISNLAVNISPPTPPRTVRTDTTGRIRLFNIPYEGLNISFVHNNYPYEQEISPLPEEPLVIELHPLLKITDLRVEKKDEGCSQIFLNASDERPDAKISVHASYAGGLVPKNFETIGQNRFAVAICSQTDVNVTVTATDQYESVGESVLVKGVTIVNIVNTTSLEVGKTVSPPPEEEASEDRLLVVVQVFFLTVLLVTLFIFRSSIVFAIRCVSQYIRNFMPKKKEGQGGSQPPSGQQGGSPPPGGGQ